MAYTMAYVSKDAIFYLATNKNIRKVQNIMLNPRVAYTVDEDDPDWFDMQALQMEGRAAISADEKELCEVGEIMAAKFPITINYLPTRISL